MRTVGITAKAKQGSCQSYTRKSRAGLPSNQGNSRVKLSPFAGLVRLIFFLSTLDIFDECRRMTSTPLDTILG